MKVTKTNSEEAQGRKSRQIGNLNKQKILRFILKQPRTFKQLENAKIVSTPILSKHLKTLLTEGLIEKTIKNNEVVYQVVSKKEAKNEMIALISFIFGYIFGKGISPESIEFVEKIIELEEVKE